MSSGSLSKKKPSVLVLVSAILCVLSVVVIYVLTSLPGPNDDGIVILDSTNGTIFEAELKKYSSNNKFEAELNKGDIVKVEFERKNGEISLSINGKNGSEPYTGNALKSGMFTFTVQETDTYAFSLAGKDASGKIKIVNLSDSKNQAETTQ